MPPIILRKKKFTVKKGRVAGGGVYNKVGLRDGRSLHFGGAICCSIHAQLALSLQLHQ